MGNIGTVDLGDGLVLMYGDSALSGVVSILY